MTHRRKAPTTNAVKDGGTDTPEARPVAVAESVSGNEDAAAPTDGTDESSPVAEAVDTVQERASAVVEALTGSDETPDESTGSTASDVAAAVRRRVSRVYGALTGAETTETPASEGAIVSACG